MMNKGGGYKQKDHDMIMNKRNEGEKWSYYMITPKSQQNLNTTLGVAQERTNYTQKGWHLKPITSKE